VVINLEDHLRYEKVILNDWMHTALLGLKAG